MHIRLLALGTRGDVQPYIALGLGLQRAGFDVALATPVDFVGFVESYGLRCVPSVMDVQAMIRRSTAGSGRSAKWEFLQMMLDETLRLTEGADLLVFSPAAIFAAPHAAEKLNIPAIPTALQPFLHPTGDFPAVGMPGLNLGEWYNKLTYPMMERFVWTFIRSRIDRWRTDKLGLPPYAKSSPFAALREGDAPVLYGYSRYVLPKPTEWSANAHVTGYWFLDDPTPPPDSLAQFVAAGAAPVYIGFGSMASRDPEQMAQIILEAVKIAGVRAVIASGWGGLKAQKLPADVFLIDSAPHDWLFPKSAAVVHHGGAGTTAAGLRAGVPSVIIPFKGDQPFWGKRVRDLGVGPAPIPRRDLSAEKLASALRACIEDQTMRQKAADLGARIRTEDGGGEAVRLIGDYARKLTETSHMKAQP